MAFGGTNVNNGQNGFQDLWDSIRKYILPSGMGGGYTEKEKKNVEESLKIADETTPSLRDIGLGGIDDTMQWVLIAVVGFGVLYLFKD